MTEKAKAATPPRAQYHLLISVDPELLNCAFVWVHHGDLPVLYPLESFSWGSFDQSQGCTAFPVPASKILKCDFFPEPILAFVKEWLETVRAENPSATKQVKAGT